MQLPPRILLLASLLCLPALPAGAQVNLDPSGHWEGTIQAPNMEVKIEIDLSKDSKGELAGSFGQLAQNLKGLPLANVAVDGRSVGFQIRGSAPGERVFKGTLSADGRSMAGDFTQAGFTIPFNLTRSGDARIETPARNAAISKELEGSWNGTLDVNGVQKRLVLTLSNQADGTSAGSFVNVDEGLEIPITTIVQKASSVTLDVKAVGGSYSGALNPEGTELVGTLTQGPLALPVTFRRGAATAGKK
jgi:hypothetical protein